MPYFKVATIIIQNFHPLTVVRRLVLFVMRDKTVKLQS